MTKVEMDGAGVVVRIARGPALSCSAACRYGIA